MAAFVYIVGSICEQLFHVGCVFVRSRGSILDCWRYIIEKRQKQLTERYLKFIDPSQDQLQENQTTNKFKEYIKLLLCIANTRAHTSISSLLADVTFILQRELMDDEISEFIHVEEEVDFACIKVSAYSCIVFVQKWL